MSSSISSLLDNREAQPTFMHVAPLHPPHAISARAGSGFQICMHFLSTFLAFAAPLKFCKSHFPLFAPRLPPRITKATPATRIRTERTAPWQDTGAQFQSQAWHRRECCEKRRSLSCLGSKLQRAIDDVGGPLPAP